MPGNFKAVCLFVASLCGVAQAGDLTISTWGGGYGDVYSQKVLKPFGQTRNILVAQKLSTDDLAGGEVEFQAADAIEVGLYEAIQGCESGDLMLLPPQSVSAFRDIQSYLPNTVQPCAIGQWAWGTLVGFSSSAEGVDMSRPALISDFFNVEDFPGLRVARRSPRILAEWALAASGVPSNQIYFALADVGAVWPLIEKQLSYLENNVLWVDSDAEALSLLREGKATFAMLSTNSVAKEALTTGIAPDVIWDAAVLEVSMLAIPSSAKNPELSLELLDYISNPEHTLDFAATLGFSPIELESARMLHSAYRKYLPVEVSRYENAIWGNSQWWSGAQSEKLVQLFAKWVTQVQSLQSLAMAGQGGFQDIAGALLPQHAGLDEQFIEMNF